MKRKILLLLAAALLTAGCGAAPALNSTATAENTAREMQFHEQTEDTAVVQQAGLTRGTAGSLPFLRKGGCGKGTKFL